MYAMQDGTCAARLVSATKTYYMGNQYDSCDEGGEIKNMDRDLNPQIHIYASKVSCRGCSSIQCNTCSGPATPGSG